MYRGPNSQRIYQQQSDATFRYAGQSVTWYRYLTAITGVPAAGISNTPQYRTGMITALFGPVDNAETQTPAGMIAGDMFTCTTREPMMRQDVLSWNGNTYRIESEPVFIPLQSAYTCIVKRGSV